MNYLKIFEDYIPLTSESDFDEITTSDEYITILYGNKDPNSDINDIKQHIENRWEKFTTKEINKIRDLFYPKRQSGVTSIGKKGCSMSFTNLTQSIGIKKLKDNWFLVTFSGGINEVNHDMRFKCDGWVGLMKCLKHLKKRNIKLFKSVYFKQFEAIDYTQYFEEISAGEYYVLFSGPTNNADDQQMHMDKKWVDFTDSELKSIKSFFKPNKHPSDRNSKYYNCRIRFYKPGGGNINITKLSDDSYLIYLMGKMEDSERGPRRDENLHFFKCDSWNGFIMCLKYLRKNMSKDVSHYKRLFK